MRFDLIVGFVNPNITEKVIKTAKNSGATGDVIIQLAKSMGGFIADGEVLLVVLSALILSLTLWLAGSSAWALFKPGDSSKPNTAQKKS